MSKEEKLHNITIFREVDTSALADFHARPLFWSNWNLEMLVFVEGRKPENPEKNPRSKARTNNKLNPHMTPGRNRTQANWWEPSALTTAPSLFPGYIVMQTRNVNLVKGYCALCHRPPSAS